jgi:hypothetical protein
MDPELEDKKVIAKTQSLLSEVTGTDVEEGEMEMVEGVIRQYAKTM